MSDHERKVNQRDLAAYENMDLELLAKRDQQSVPIQMSQERDLARKVNGLDAIPPNNKSNPFLQPRETNQYQMPPRLIKMATKNMEDPSVVYMRHNTFNKAYGMHRPEINKELNASVDTAKMAQAPSNVENTSNEMQYGARLLADAGKAQMFNVPRKINSRESRDQVGSRGVFQNAPMKLANDYNNMQTREIKPAGSVRRQMATYNILTGKEIPQKANEPIISKHLIYQANDQIPRHAIY